jgi:hypothetical protein
MRLVKNSQGDYCHHRGQYQEQYDTMKSSFPGAVVHASPILNQSGEADIIDIWRCAEPIPQEWYEYDRNGLAESSRQSVSAEP